MPLRRCVGLLKPNELLIFENELVGIEAARAVGDLASVGCRRNDQRRSSGERVWAAC
jgi:hypothetical protein